MHVRDMVTWVFRHLNHSNPETPSSSPESEAVVAPPDPPLTLSLHDGWDRPLTTSTDIEAVRSHDRLIYGVETAHQRIVTVANAIAGLDNGPADLNENRGIILVEGEHMPSLPRMSPGSAEVEFNELREITHADIRYSRHNTYEGWGGGEERFEYLHAPDGTQVFTLTDHGSYMKGWDNHIERYTRVTTWKVDAGGEISQSESRLK